MMTTNMTARHDDPIQFRGRSRADAKRKALNYWYINKDALRLSLREFSACLVLREDGKTILLDTTRR